jgi:hypothetical protein
MRSAFFCSATRVSVPFTWSLCGGERPNTELADNSPAAAEVSDRKSGRHREWISIRNMPKIQVEESSRLVPTIGVFQPADSTISRALLT